MLKEGCCQLGRGGCLLTLNSNDHPQPQKRFSSFSYYLKVLGKMVVRALNPGVEIWPSYEGFTIIMFIQNDKNTITFCQTLEHRKACVKIPLHSLIYICSILCEKVKLFIFNYIELFSIKCLRLLCQETNITIFQE